MNKFNIGDIVKLNFSDSIYSGKEFKVTDCENGFYILKSDGHNCYGVAEEYLEVVEDSGMNNKELTFKEVISMIKEGEVWENEELELQIRLDNTDRFYIGDLNDNVIDNFVGQYIERNNKFKLRRKKYAFEEAFRSYEEGKEIESCVDGEVYNKLKEDKDMDKLFNASQIRGKWYINNK